MSNKYHDQMTGTDNHVVHSYTYADATAREAASGFTAEDVGKIALQQNNQSFHILIDHDPITWMDFTHPDADEKVKVSGTDTTTDYLLNKLVQSGIVQITRQNQGGNETLQIHVANTNTDEAVKVSANDTTAGDLEAKVEAGAGIALSTTNEGGNEKLRIATTTGGVDSDENVKVSANDTTAGKLTDKLVQGTNITLTEQNDGGNETLLIAADLSGAGNPDRFNKWTAIDWINPCNNDWPVTKLARLRRDPISFGFHVREFDDNRKEGVAGLLVVPSGVTNITLRLKGRAQTSPGSSKNVAIGMYWRKLPDDAATTAWSSEVQWNNFVTMDDNHWHYWENTHTLTAEGLTAGLYQFELVRDTADATDTLVGNWLMVWTEVEFS